MEFAFWNAESLLSFFPPLHSLKSAQCMFQCCGVSLALQVEWELFPCSLHFQLLPGVSVLCLVKESLGTGAFTQKIFLCLPGIVSAHLCN